jgi:hypothetical protein
MALVKRCQAVDTRPGHRQAPAEAAELQVFIVCFRTQLLFGTSANAESLWIESDII